MTRDTRPFIHDYRPSRYQSPWGEQTGSQYRVLCSDGIVRIATATAEADTFFTVPARVTVRGVTVTGHVYDRGLEETGPQFRFSASTYRKNARMLPEWAS